MFQCSETVGVHKQRRGEFSYHEQGVTDCVMYHVWYGGVVRCYGRYFGGFPSL